MAVLQVEVADRDAALAQRDAAVAALEHRLTHVALDKVGLRMHSIFSSVSKSDHEI